jgi:lactate dehydrogenase-like 2-hydroxyacid dehydrogenase
MKPEILLTMPIYPPVAAELDRAYTVHRLWTATDPSRLLRETCGAVRAVVTVGAAGLQPGIVDALPRLELVACFGTPNARVQFPGVAARGLPITNTPDDILGTVAELAAGMAIALMRGIVRNDRFVRLGRWPEDAPHAGNTLIGASCGIVGLGGIGREVATRLAAFGMLISYQGPRRKTNVSYEYFESVRDLARSADCLVITCASTPETAGLIDEGVLDALGTEGYLVNVARGPIVDEHALLAALGEKRIAGAALDVFWNEPRVPAELMDMDNVVLLPHIGSTTREIREERGRKLMANLRAHFAGVPLPYVLRRSEVS